MERAADRFRLQTLQSRYSAFAELWDKRMQAREEGRTGPIHRVVHVVPRADATSAPDAASAGKVAAKKPQASAAPDVAALLAAAERAVGGGAPAAAQPARPDAAARLLRKTEEPGRLHASFPEVRRGPAGAGRGRVEAEIREVRGIGEAAGGRDPQEDRLVAARLRGPDDRRTGPPRRPSRSSRAEGVTMHSPLQKALLPGAILVAFLGRRSRGREGLLQGVPRPRDPSPRRDPRHPLERSRRPRQTARSTTTSAASWPGTASGATPSGASTRPPSSRRRTPGPRSTPASSRPFTGSGGARARASTRR